METSNHFTCLSYDIVDFLIPSEYILFGIYLPKDNDEKHIFFENETLPHIRMGSFLEKQFNCKSVQDCSVMMVMNKADFALNVQKLIVSHTETKFPASGNLAISVNSSVTSKIIDIQSLKPLPKGMRPRRKKNGICAIGFQQDENNPQLERKQILISFDNLLLKLIGGKK